MSELNDLITELIQERISHRKALSDCGYYLAVLIDRLAPNDSVLISQTEFDSMLNSTVRISRVETGMELTLGRPVETTEMTHHVNPV